MILLKMETIHFFIKPKINKLPLPFSKTVSVVEFSAYQRSYLNYLLTKRFYKRVDITLIETRVSSYYKV